MERRSGLGRGLDALLPSTPRPAEESVSPAASPVAGVELRELPLTAITAGGFQPRRRFDDEALEELTASVTELGVLQPVLVRPAGAGFELIAGERRWRAARAAGLTTIPALVRTIDDATALEQALVENLQRDDLTALEEAAAYQQLLDDFGCTQDEVARKVGRSRTAVTNTLRLLQLPPGVQKLVVERELSAGHARALLGLPTADAQLALARRTIAEGWSVRQVEAAVRRATRPTAPAEPVAPGSTRPAGVLEVERQLGDRLGTRVQVQLGKGRGRIQIDFADLDDLSRIYDLLGPGPSED